MKSPAFQFYPQDFLLGTSDLSAEEVGGYIRLLAHQWDKGGLPNNEKKLLKLAGVKPKALANILNKFELQEDSQLRNKRLEKERTKQKEWKTKSSVAGKKSGEARRNQTQTKDEPTFKNGSNQTRTLQSSSSSSIKEIYKEKFFKDKAFTESLLHSWRVNEQQLSLLVDDFELWLSANEKSHKDYAAYKSHFFNWGKQNYLKVLDMVDEYTDKMTRAL